LVDVVALMGAYHTTSMLFAVERYPLPPVSIMGRSDWTVRE